MWALTGRWYALPACTLAGAGLGYAYDDRRGLLRDRAAYEQAAKAAYESEARTATLKESGYSTDASATLWKRDHPYDPWYATWSAKNPMQRSDLYSMKW